MTRISKKNIAALKKLGGNTPNIKKRNAALKECCRLAIRAAFPSVEQPLVEHPEDAIRWYEGNGYRAPFWLLQKVNATGRYQ